MEVKMKTRNYKYKNGLIVNLIGNMNKEMESNIFTSVDQTETNNSDKANYMYVKAKESFEENKYGRVCKNIYDLINQHYFQHSDYEIIYTLHSETVMKKNERIWLRKLDHRRMKLKKKEKT